MLILAPARPGPNPPRPLNFAEHEVESLRARSERLELRVSRSSEASDGTENLTSAAFSLAGRLRAYNFEVGSNDLAPGEWTRL
jgi:hypothetical protein